MKDSAPRFIQMYVPVMCDLQLNTMKLALEGVEKERDFYFGKLREVELLCQEQGPENTPFVERLMEVLYSADDQVSTNNAYTPLLG